MVEFQINNKEFESKIRTQFAQQTMMQTLGMTLSSVKAGAVEILMDFNPTLVQHHGYHHAGVATTGMDTACGFAALSLMKSEQEVLTVEFKSSFLRPALASRFRFVGEVTKAGKALYFCDGKAFGVENDKEQLIATLSATMMAVENN